MKCEYGCGQEAKFQTKSGKWCCSKSPNSCPELKRKNSYGLKKAYQEGRKNCNQFDGKREWAKGKSAISDKRIKVKKFTIEQIFIKESTATRTRVRDLVIKEKLIEYKCKECKLSNWNNKPITLELDHINGNVNDNRLENLRFLCPNCHSQTETFCGKNINKGVEKVSEELLVKSLRESQSIHNALKNVGLAAKGGNYNRAWSLINKYNILHLKISP